MEKIRSRGRPEGRRNTRSIQIDKDKGLMFSNGMEESHQLLRRKMLAHGHATAREFLKCDDYHLKESLKENSGMIVQSGN